jgi:hypothetical protein
VSQNKQFRIFVLSMMGLPFAKGHLLANIRIAGFTGKPTLKMAVPFQKRRVIFRPVASP